MQVFGGGHQRRHGNFRDPGAPDASMVGAGLVLVALLFLAFFTLVWALAVLVAGGHGVLAVLLLLVVGLLLGSVTGSMLRDAR